MSSVSSYSNLKFCQIETSFNTNAQFVCYKYEKCCQQGCCSTYTYRYFKSWYFWLTILILFVIIYCVSHCCKKLERARKRRLQALQNVDGTGPSSRQSSEQNYARRNESNVDHNLLDYIIHIFGNHQCVSECSSNRKDTTILEPPPKYQDAVRMPSMDINDVQIAQVHFQTETGGRRVTLLENDDQVPPTYEVAVMKSKIATYKK